jgi:hypothetical protein
MQSAINTCIHAHFVGGLCGKTPLSNLVASNNVLSQPHSTAIYSAVRPLSIPHVSRPSGGFRMQTCVYRCKARLHGHPQVAQILFE